MLLLVLETSLLDSCNSISVSCIGMRWKEIVSPDGSEHNLYESHTNTEITWLKRKNLSYRSSWHFITFHDFVRLRKQKELNNAKVNEHWNIIHSTKWTISDWKIISLHFLFFHMLLKMFCSQSEKRRRVNQEVSQNDKFMAKVTWKSITFDDSGECLRKQTSSS
jgi:hypothetical protein